MQGQSTEKSNNIVSLFGARQEAQQKAESDTTKKSDDKAKESAEFTDVMRRNAENSERLRRERNKANQSVLKSYRIKN